VNDTSAGRASVSWENRAMALLLALIAAAAHGGATALQQHEARAAPGEFSLRSGLLGRRVRRPVWLVGLAADAVGFGLQAPALTAGSLVLVQPALSANLLCGLVAAAALAHNRLTAAQMRAAMAVVAGLAVFLAVAQPTTHSHAHATVAAWVTVVGGVGRASGGGSRRALRRQRAGA
jgi:uncharacterized membrane protein YhaH (DUF805 family)